MELYLYKRKRDWKDFLKTYSYAKLTARWTGKNILYHWFDAISCYLKYGCSPLQYYEGGFYKLRSFDRKEAYTKRRIKKCTTIYNDKTNEYLLGNKIEFNKHFTDFVKRKWIDCKTSTSPEIEEFLKSVGPCIIKPTNGAKGKGIKTCQGEDIKTLAKNISGKDYIMEEIIKQHPKMCFNNKSVNTLRIMTILDKSGDVHILKIGLRCGIGDSVVDNFCAGGVIYPIDIHYGRICGPGVTNSLGQQVYVHPGTKTYMLGQEIPFWEETIDFVKQAAKHIPQVRFIGWDVAITSDGPIMIEGNQGPGVVFDPLNMNHGLYKEIMSYK